jgi:hypothetical protein
VELVRTNVRVRSPGTRVTATGASDAGMDGDGVSEAEAGVTDGETDADDVTDDVTESVGDTEGDTEAPSTPAVNWRVVCATQARARTRDREG